MKARVDRLGEIRHRCFLELCLDYKLFFEVGLVESGTWGWRNSNRFWLILWLLLEMWQVNVFIGSLAWDLEQPKKKIILSIFGLNIIRIYAYIKYMLFFIYPDRLFLWFPLLRKRWVEKSPDFRFIFHLLGVKIFFSQKIVVPLRTRVVIQHLGLIILLVFLLNLFILVVEKLIVLLEGVLRLPGKEPRMISVHWRLDFRETFNCFLSHSRQGPLLIEGSSRHRALLLPELRNLVLRQLRVDYGIGVSVRFRSGS